MPERITEGELRKDRLVDEIKKNIAKCDEKIDGPGWSDENKTYARTSKVTYHVVLALIETIL